MPTPLTPAIRTALRTGYDSEAVLLMHNPDGSVSAFRLQLDPLRTSTPDSTGVTELSARGTVLGSHVFEPEETQARTAGEWYADALPALELER